MRKTFLIIAIIASAISSVFAQTNTSTTDTGVVINGVRWATRNVAVPGTFAVKAEDAGMFYQWNSKVGWPSTGTIGKITATNGTTKWNSSWTGGYANPSTSDTWQAANDPSPKGWRVPTLAEVKTLLDTTKVTSLVFIQNEVYGKKYTDKSTGNSIFLPSLGYRVDYDGSLDPPLDGIYWNSVGWYNNSTYGEEFNVNDANRNNDDRALGLTVRSVAE